MVTNFFELATTLKNLGNQKKKIDFSLGASSRPQRRLNCLSQFLFHLNLILRHILSLLPLGFKMKKKKSTVLPEDDGEGVLPENLKANH